MSVRAALHQTLLNDAVVGGLVATRIAPAISPQADILPRVTYQKISNRHLRYMTNAAGLARGSWQIGCYADTYEGADALFEAVRIALDHFFEGPLGEPANQHAVDSIFLENDTEEFTPDDDGSDEGIYSVLMDFTIWAREAKPPRDDRF